MRCSVMHWAVALSDLHTACACITQDKGLELLSQARLTQVVPGGGRRRGPSPRGRTKMHVCLTVECITSGLHLSVFFIRSPRLFQAASGGKLFSVLHFFIRH